MNKNNMIVFLFSQLIKQEQKADYYMKQLNKLQKDISQNEIIDINQFIDLLEIQQEPKREKLFKEIGNLIANKENINNFTKKYLI